MPDPQRSKILTEIPSRQSGICAARLVLPDFAPDMFCLRIGQLDRLRESGCTRREESAAD
jgi:hypothetical protein